MQTHRQAAAALLFPLLVSLSACSPGRIVPPGHTEPVCIRDGKDAPVPNIRMGDAATLARILDEGKHRNQVMEHLRHLTQDIGPRLTASSNAEKANNWTLAQFRSWGLDAQLFEWNTYPVRFDRGPSTGKLVRMETKKDDSGKEETTWKTIRDLELTTLCWMHGTNGPVRGPVILEPNNDEEYAKIKDKLKGAWVLEDKISTVRGNREPVTLSGKRFEARTQARKDVAEGKKKIEELPLEDRLIFDGIAGFITAADDQRDRVWTGRVPGWDKRTVGEIIPDVEVMVRCCDHDNIRTRLAAGEQFEAEFDLQNNLTAGPIPVYDTIAEIRGSEKPDEVVVVCGHMDSWNGPGSQGATDNGTGCMVALEAARILSAAHARPKRTIRFCLWTGEEQGLLGSKAYVKSLGDSVSKISVCLNDDGGTNYEGGLLCTPDMADYLAAATAPINYQFTDFMDGKPLNSNIHTQEKFPRGGGSDHASFTEVGVPGFFWDEVGRADYGWGWHTQHDRFDLAIREYLEQSATSQAVTAYNLACAPDLLPRVPPPDPEETKKAEEERKQRGIPK
jgi:hypothetical protein